MREISTSVTFEITDSEVVPMRIGRSVKLTVQGAPVWATRSNDIRDYWLLPGDSIKLQARERLWLSTENGHRAQIVFARGTRMDKRAIGWFARRMERLADRFRSGWRVV
jgi:hypothetical protein